jgi:NADH:ubiquinone oxidoreductase subunit F (NADH-binding)
MSGPENVRLLTGTSGHTTSLEEHERRFGPLPSPHDLVDTLEQSGLRGRGGAAFPTARKVRLIRDQRSHHKYVVVNAMEGEPAAHKDQSLIAINPHLILDGAELLAKALGAREIAVCVAREHGASVNRLERAIHERGRRSSHVNFELHTPPGRYIAGEESALVHWLDDNETLPQYRPARPTILRIGRGPVLVDNAETHANVALIARYGAQWFRGVGPASHPGTTLVSVSGAVARPVVIEVALGTPIRDILAAAHGDPAPRALLLGGYGGIWVDGRHVDLPYDNDALGAIGASVGAGVIVVVPEGACGLTETHNIARWMANESARQCGPCAFGLPAIADDLGLLCRDASTGPPALDRLRGRLGEVAGRGACRHPDGVIRLVESALSVFSDDVAEHVRGRRCASSGASHFASVPHLELEHELVWQ